MLGSVYLASFKLFNTQTTTVDIQTQSTLALDEITRTLAQAHSIKDCPFSETDLYILQTLADCDDNPTDANNIVFSLWPLDSLGQPYDPETLSSGEITGDLVFYTVNNNSLEKKSISYTDDGSWAVISSRASNNCSGFHCDNIDIVIPNIKLLTFRYYTQGNDTPDDCDYDYPSPGEARDACFASISEVEVEITTWKIIYTPGAEPDDPGNKVESTRKKRVNLRNYIP